MAESTKQRTTLAWHYYFLSTKYTLDLQIVFQRPFALIDARVDNDNKRQTSTRATSFQWQYKTPTTWGMICSVGRLCDSTCHRIWQVVPFVEFRNSRKYPIAIVPESGSGILVVLVFVVVVRCSVFGNDLKTVEINTPTFLLGWRRCWDYDDQCCDVSCDGCCVLKGGCRSGYDLRQHRRQEWIGYIVRRPDCVSLFSMFGLHTNCSQKRHDRRGQRYFCRILYSCPHTGRDSSWFPWWFVCHDPCFGHDLVGRNDTIVGMVEVPWWTIWSNSLAALVIPLTTFTC